MSKEEIEIDLNADTPLSKKELRRIKKGKTTLEKLQKKKAKKLASAASATSNIGSTDKSENNESVNNNSNNDNDDNDDKDKDKVKEETNSTTGPKRSDFGIWIGNLSFDTTRDELTNFLTLKGENISKSDISRVNLPTRGTKNRGFAYVDFFDDEHLQSALKLSEFDLNGRKVLIKNAKSYEGRPEKPQGMTSTLSKNPPSRILFVGNLSFDTTSDLLKDHFKHCGEIIKIRMATFEDSGKCKGFAFIDFKDIEGPTNALKDRSCKKLINRPIRLEFGEDRSQRKVVPKRSFDESNNDSSAENQNNNNNNEYTPRENKGFQPKQDKSAKRIHTSHKADTRMNSSIALANAQRQSAAIVKSTGKKLTFD